MPARPWNAAEGQHVMVELSAEERRRRQQATLDAPRRRYGGDARLLFWVEDLVFGKARTLPKFKARELIARTPYQAWEQGAYFEVTVDHDMLDAARRLQGHVVDARSEQDNEQWHLFVLEALIVQAGAREGLIRFRLVSQIMAFAMFQLFCVLYAFDRRWSYRLNADIEDHAAYEYAALVAEHPEWETAPVVPDIAAVYGTFESVADLLRQVGCDESVHKAQSEAWASSRSGTT